MKQIPAFIQYLKQEYGIVNVRPFLPPNKLEFHYFLADTPCGQKVFIKLEGKVKQAAAREAFFIDLLRRWTKIGFFPKVAACQANGDFPFIATEFIAGPNLEKFLAHNKPNDGEKFQLLHQMNAILNILHSTGTVHRDIRPPNLMVRTSDRGRRLRLVLIDFAYAVLLKPAPLPELPFVAANTAILRKLGTGYKPGEFQWDDAYSFCEIARTLEPHCPEKFPEIWSTLRAAAGKVTYTYKGR